MKLTKIVLGLFVLLLLLTACEAKPQESGGESSLSGASLPSDVESSSPTVAYTFDREVFTGQYQEAQKRIGQGEKPAQAAPQSPEESGFAVITLALELYGVESYAILPLSERALTEEELLQLADAMDGIPAEALLTPRYSRTGLEEDPVFLQQNRALQRGEKLRFDLLQPEYLYAEKRPEADPRENDPQKSAPCFVKIPGQGDEVLFRILPEAPMDDGQLLQYLDAQMEGVPPESYLPLEDEIAYRELPSHLQREIEAYQLGDQTLPDYTAILSTSVGEARTASQEAWAVTLLYPEGDQYVITLDAGTGALKSWLRWPAGTFTGETLPEVSEPAESPERSPEELKAAAAGYLEQTIPGDWEIAEIQAEETSRFLEGYGASRRVSVTLKDGRKYRLALLEQDLSVANFIIEKAD